MRQVDGAALDAFAKTLGTVERMGDFSQPVEGFCSLNRPKSGCIMWIKKPEKVSLENFAGCQDNVIVTPKPVENPIENVRYLITAEPKAIFFSILKEFWGTVRTPGIASDATVETDKIGKNVVIGHHCYIGPDVTIGDGTVIESNVNIISPAVIGKDCLIHAGAVIGSDGFGFFTENGVPQKVEHFGGVRIGDRVELGANSIVARGTIDDTEIGNDVKIDALCHVAHNVVIEDNAMLTANVVLCGSSHVGKGSYMAPGSILRNQARLGRHVFTSMGSVVSRNVKDNGVVLGRRVRYLAGPWEDLGIKL